MRKCPYCNEDVPHLKKHLKKKHPKEYQKKINIKRPRTHQIETLSDTFLEKFFSKWVCNKYNPDYGLDYKITIVKDENITEFFFFVQNKGTDVIDVKKNYVNFDFEVKYLCYYLKLPTPVILIRYDAQSDCAYWLNIQKYCKNILDVESPSWRNQITKRVKIPVENRLNDINIIRNDIIQSTKENIRFAVEKFDWHEGYEEILSDPEKIEKIINKTEIDNIKARLHTSILYFRRDDLEKMQEQYIEIYKQKRGDKHHLQAILAILASTNLFILQKNDPLISLSDEGLKLSEKLQNELYIDIFSFFMSYYKAFEIIKQKLPIIIKRAEVARNQIDVDEFIKFIWDLEDVGLNELLEKNSKEMSKILLKLLENGQLYEFLVLLLHLLQIEILVNYTLKNFVEKSLLSEILKKHKDLIEKILDLSQRLDYKDLLLQTYLIIGGYFELFNLDKAKEIYTKGLELANEISHLFYIKKFNYNLNELGKDFRPFTLNDVIEMPLSTSIQTIKSFKLSNIDTIPDPHIKESLKVALNDIDPIEFLKHCEFIAVGYYPSKLGQAFGIYSLGAKKIACLKNKMIYDSRQLTDTFELFKKNFCEGCEYRKPREDNFDPPLKIIDEMHFKIQDLERIINYYGYFD